VADYILVNDDQALFMPGFGAAVVTVRPGKLVASGPATIGGQKVCIDGDEKSVKVAGCMYITPSHSVPGTGTLEIQALGGDQKAQKTRSKGKPVLLVGKKFTAKFSVQSPAKMPPPANTPDGMAQYAGNGKFLTANRKFKGV
jgi:hypothetical protein